MDILKLLQGFFTLETEMSIDSIIITALCCGKVELVDTATHVVKFRLM